MHGKNIVTMLALFLVILATAMASAIPNADISSKYRQCTNKAYGILTAPFKIQKSPAFLTNSPLSAICPNCALRA
jgi:hypothetical protein